MLNEMGSEIKFRLLCEADLEMLRKWRMKPEVTKYLYTNPILTSEDQMKWFLDLQKKDDIYWIINFRGIAIGYAALRNVSNISADPGVFIAETEYRSKGIGKYVIGEVQEYAFTVLGLRKLYGPILSENLNALMTYLKNGWTVEGVLRDHIYKDKLYDVYMIALFKKDWRKKYENSKE